MRFSSTASGKAIGIAAIAIAALATGACSGGNKAAANNAAAALPMNTSTFGNDASAMESIGTHSTNTLTPLPPMAEPTTRNSAAPTGNGSSMRDTAPSNGPTRVESNVSGM